MAWGGRHTGALPAGLRAASAASLLIVACGLVAVLRVEHAIGWPEPALATGMLWALSALFALSFVGNAASSSLPERIFGVPMTVALASGCALLALRGA
jgi:hypothetical protein